MVDVYPSPVTVAASIPSYLVTPFVYAAGLEKVVCLFDHLAPGDGHYFRETDNVATC